HLFVRAAWAKNPVGGWARRCFATSRGFTFRRLDRFGQARIDLRALIDGARVGFLLRRELLGLFLASGHVGKKTQGEPPSGECFLSLHRGPGSTQVMPVV